MVYQDHTLTNPAPGPGSCNILISSLGDFLRGHSSLWVSTAAAVPETLPPSHRPVVQSSASPPTPVTCACVPLLISSSESLQDHPPAKDRQLTPSRHLPHRGLLTLLLTPKIYELAFISSPSSLVTDHRYQHRRAVRLRTEVLSDNGDIFCEQLGRKSNCLRYSTKV